MKHFTLANNSQVTAQTLTPCNAFTKEDQIGALSHNYKNTRKDLIIIEKVNLVIRN